MQLSNRSNKMCLEAIEVTLKVATWNCRHSASGTVYDLSHCANSWL